MRISRQSMFMQIAHVVSQRSTCFRLNVGAVIVQNNNIKSIGYNGRPAGEEHCQGHECPGRFSCKETTHAERNAVDRLGILAEAGETYFHRELYCTDSPCPDCMRYLMQERFHISRVYFSREYRLNDHLHALKDANIELYQVMPSGYVVDWFSKEIVNELSLIRK